MNLFLSQRYLQLAADARSSLAGLRGINLGADRAETKAVGYLLLTPARPPAQTRLCPDGVSCERPVPPCPAPPCPACPVPGVCQL